MTIFTESKMHLWHCFANFCCQIQLFSFCLDYCQTNETNLSFATLTVDYSGPTISIKYHASMKMTFCFDFNRIVIVNQVACEAALECSFKILQFHAPMQRIRKVKITIRMQACFKGLRFRPLQWPSTRQCWRKWVQYHFFECTVFYILE